MFRKYVGEPLNATCTHVFDVYQYYMQHAVLYITVLRVTVLIALEPLRAEAAGTVLAVIDFSQWNVLVLCERMVVTALFRVFTRHLEYIQGKRYHRISNYWN